MRWWPPELAEDDDNEEIGIKGVGVGARGCANVNANLLAMIITTRV